MVEQVDSSRSTTPESDVSAEADHSSDSSETECSSNLTPISEPSTETADVSDDGQSTAVTEPAPLVKSAPEESVKCKDLGYHSLERETGRKSAASSARHWIDQLKTTGHPEPTLMSSPPIQRKSPTETAENHRNAAGKQNFKSTAVLKITRSRYNSDGNDLTFAVRVLFDEN